MGLTKFIINNWLFTRYQRWSYHQRLKKQLQNGEFGWIKYLQISTPIEHWFEAIELCVELSGPTEPVLAVKLGYLSEEKARELSRGSGQAVYHWIKENRDADHELAAAALQSRSFLAMAREKGILSEPQCEEIENLYNAQTREDIEIEDAYIRLGHLSTKDLQYLTKQFDAKKMP